MTLVRTSAAAVLWALAAGAEAREAGSQAPRPGEGTIAARLGELPATARAAWEAYVERSRQLAALDRATMARELAQVGRERMARAPYASTSFEGPGQRPEEWFASPEARRLGDVIVTYQTPSGGWSKRVAYDSARAPGQSWYSESDGWSYIATFDNNATTSQLRYLGRLQRVQPVAAHADAFMRGLRYLLDAQYPNGCVPQVYPLQGGYHDAATFNDESTVNVLRLLDEIAGGAFPFVPPEARARTAAAARRGVECVLDAQVRVGGTLTAWGQQHDPITLAPVAARSYELRSLGGRESAGVMTYLMSLPDPGPRVMEAIDAVAAHFRATAIHGYRYDYQQGLTRDPAGAPIWARMLEIGTNRPLFANRDGVVLHDWNLLTDRRTGYAWFGTEPGSALKKYGKWRRAHPIPVEK